MAAHFMKERLLVVDDSPDTREVIQRNLSAHGYQVFTAGNVAEAKIFLGTSKVDLVITDLKMPGASGLDLVRHVKEKLADTAVMMLTGYPFIADAIKEEEPGAEGYLAKPFTQDELLAIVRSRLDKLQAKRVAQQEYASLAGLIGESAPMRAVFEAIKNARITSSPVMITGEIGTGKALAARAIHYGSPRAAFPFLSVDSRSLPQSRADRELFCSPPDQVEGAIERTSIFQLGNGGTVFISEIGALPTPAQIGLLDLLREGGSIASGFQERVKTDVRILAATDRLISKMAEKGTFHPELLHRLGGVTISLPPLRERGDDVRILVRHFIEKYAYDYGSPAKRISEEALALLQTYSWPGNVRELENMVQLMVLACAGEMIDIAEIPILRLSTSDKSRLRRTLAELETEYVQVVLASVGGTKAGQRKSWVSIARL